MCLGGWVWGVWGGGQVQGLVGKVSGVRTMIAASKRGLHGFPPTSCTCHYGITDATSTFSIQRRGAGPEPQNTSTLVQAQSLDKRGNEGGAVRSTGRLESRSFFFPGLDPTVLIQDKTVCVCGLKGSPCSMFGDGIDAEMATTIRKPNSNPLCCSMAVTNHPDRFNYTTKSMLM